jgi:hypothetical protein
MKITTTEALHTLAESGKLFTEVFNHGSLMVEIYKPENQDLQKPHDRDEIYVVISGTGIFYLNGERFPFSPEISSLCLLISNIVLNRLPLILPPGYFSTAQWEVNNLLFILTSVEIDYIDKIANIQNQIIMKRLLIFHCAVCFYYAIMGTSANG